MTIADQNLIERNACPICARIGKVITNVPLDHPHLIEEYARRNFVIPTSLLENERFELRYCKHDRLYFQSRIGNDEQSTAHYEEWIDLDTSLARVLDEKGTKKPFKGMAFLSMIARLTIGLDAANVKILDFGAGWGHLARKISAFHYPVTNSEFSPKRIQYMRDAGQDVRDSDIASWADQEFDIIIIDSVLEHVSNPKEILAELGRVTKSGGHIVLSVPNCGPLISRFLKRPILPADVAQWSDRTNRLLTPLAHINGFTPFALQQLGFSAGLQPVKKWGLYLEAHRPRQLVRSALGSYWPNTFQVFRVEH